MWTYGLVQHVDDDEVVYELAEIYRFGEEEGQGYCAPFLISESVDGVKEILKKMLDALDDPKIIEGVKEADDES